ncbi:unnamed protein product [Diamesa serratosioi]
MNERFPNAISRSSGSGSLSFSEWIDYSQKMKPQSNAMSGGILCILISGLHIAWIYNIDFIELPWAINKSTAIIAVVLISFYLAGIVGLIVGTLLINKLSKQTIYFICCGFFAASAIVMTVLPDLYYVILISRLLAGFAHGLCYLTVIVHGSEIMVAKLRGMVLTSLNFCIISSILVTGAYTMAYKQDTNSAIIYVGITGCIYAFMAVIFIPIFTKETPVTFIRKKRNDLALKMMLGLRNESNETWSIRNEFIELETMVSEDEQINGGIFREGNFRPIALTTLLKVGYVLSFNFPLNIVRLSLPTIFREGSFDYTVIVLMSIRMCVAMVVMFTIDKGRKIHFLISSGGCSVVLILFGTIILAIDFEEQKWLYTFLQLCYEIFSGIGMGLVADVYLSEAFNVMKKPSSIAFTTIVEFILHIVLIAFTIDIVPNVAFKTSVLLACGFSMLLITIFLNKKLPETAKMSIRQTRNEFLKRGEIVFSGNKMPHQNVTFNN